MSGSTYGNIFRVTTYGESHGKALGAVIDGCPAGVALGADDFLADMYRRKPGANAFATKRKEDDCVEILSGVFEGKTTGTPISLLIYNKDQRSRDYTSIKDVYRPGHADYTYDKKYGFRDYRGGGRSSGRETAARVAAGVVAKKILSRLSIYITAYTTKIGGISIDRNNMDISEISKNPLSMPDKKAASAALEFLELHRDDNDSYGGIIECVITGVKPGVGEPVFDKLDASLAKAVMSIGAVKGVEIGAGFGAADMTGSQCNDSLYTEDGTVRKRTNNSGGITGGISDGGDIIFRCAVKPTPSISIPQQTTDSSGNNNPVTIGGRHDFIIVPRAVVVVEAMAAITLTDHLLTGMTSKIENLELIYS